MHHGGLDGSSLVGRSKVDQPEIPCCIGGAVLGIAEKMETTDFPRPQVWFVEILHTSLLKFLREHRRGKTVWCKLSGKNSNLCSDKLDTCLYSATLTLPP